MMKNGLLHRGSFLVTMTALLAGARTSTLAQDVERFAGLKPQTERPTWVEPPFDLREYTRNLNVEQAIANNVVVYGKWDGPPLVNGIPLGFKVFDGDIVVPEGFDGQTAATFLIRWWPNNQIPFEFDGNVSQANANAMLAAMSWWENVTAIDFRPRNGDANFIHIQNNTFNNSAVGQVGDGQIVNITSWGTTAIIAHELGHAMGYYHEQSRSDRGNFVTVNTDNVCRTCCQQADGSMGSCNFNFQIENESANYGPYDFDSVMHYGRCDFSNNGACTNTCPGPGETVIVQPAFNAEWQCGNPTGTPPDNAFIGQRTHLSYWDSLVMSFIYQRFDWRFQRNSNGDDNGPGSFPAPYRTFREGWEDVPPGGTLWILEPSQHGVDWVLDKPMTIGAPLGGVVLAR